MPVINSLCFDLQRDHVVYIAVIVIVIVEVVAVVLVIVVTYPSNHVRPNGEGGVFP